ncbi:DHHW protein [Ruminococcaceae bacterium FB2012]|nr:DHHW protein [Ruminococcaceae bacterium FB2012]
MDKKIFESMRPYLAPDEKLVASVLEKAGGVRPVINSERFTEEEESRIQTSGFVRSRFGIAAAAVAVLIAVGTAVLIFHNSRLRTETSSDGASGAEAIETSSAAGTVSTSQDSSGHGLTNIIANQIIVGSGKDVRGMSWVTENEENEKKYVKVLNEYKKALGDDVNVYNLICPTASAYYMPEGKFEPSDHQHDTIKRIGEKLEGITNIDIFDTLAAHKNEYIYLRTDHRWQPLAAYYAMQKYDEIACDNSFRPLDYNYNKNVLEGFCGTMYDFTGYEEFVQNPDQLIYYEPEENPDVYWKEINYWDKTFTKIDEGKGHSFYFPVEEGKNAYTSLFGEDEDICEIKTACTNGRTLVMVKDSFGSAAVPFLLENYENIYVIDIRAIGTSIVDLAKKVNADDVLFMISAADLTCELYSDNLSEWLDTEHSEISNGEMPVNLVTTGVGKDFRGVPLFYRSDNALSEYAKALNTFKEKVGSDVKVNNMLCPTAAAYYLPDDSSVPDDTQHGAILSVGEQLEGVENIDIYYHLWMYRDEELYLRTDHRWAPLAAYYAMQRFISKAGDHEFPSIENFNENTVNKYVGTLYGYSGNNERFLDNAEKFVYYTPSEDMNYNIREINYWNKTFTELDKAKSDLKTFVFAPNFEEDIYSSVYNESDGICEIKTTCANGRTLLVVRDSFGYPAVPFLVDDYENIYCVDIRSLGTSLSELAGKVGATDVLFLVSVPTANNITYVNDLKNWL